MSNPLNVHSLKKLAGDHQLPLARAQHAVAQLGLESKLTIDGVSHFSDDDVLQIRKYIEVRHDDQRNEQPAV